jgi:hypothetical protein
MKLGASFSPRQSAPLVTAVDPEGGQKGDIRLCIDGAPAAPLRELTEMLASSTERPGQFLMSILARRRAPQTAATPPDCVALRCVTGGVFFIKTGISRSPGDEPPRRLKL